MTGASRGIGAAIAKALAAEGWPVGVNYRSDAAAAEAVVRSIEEAGGRALALAADVRTRLPPTICSRAWRRSSGRCSCS